MIFRILFRIKDSGCLRIVTPALVVGVMFLASCSTTRNVPEGKYLLNKSKIEIDTKNINSGDLNTYLKQHPNKEILGFRFHLRVYNLANPYKFGRFNNWLKTIGEEPSVLDTNLVDEGARNVLDYLKSKGYYNAIISDSIYYHGRKADVFYTITPNTPYAIRRLSYSIDDTVIQRLVKADSVNSLIVPDHLFDTDLLQKERDRIENYLKNNGYYNFSKDFVTFSADSSVGNHRVDVLMMIRNPKRLNREGKTEVMGFKQYLIKRVFIYPDYDPISFIAKKLELDTVSLNGIQYIFPDDPGIKLNVIYNANFVRPGVMFSNEIVQRSQNNLNLLKLYKFVNISFVENNEEPKPVQFDPFLGEQDSFPAELFGYLDCHIQLSKHTLQSYQVELVGTNTTGSLGAEGNLGYQHKNLFRGAEVFDIKFRGLVESAQQKINLNNTLELGGSLGLSIPKFLGPFSSSDFFIRNAVKTQIVASYSFQRRPDYTRTIASLTYGYTWKSSRHITQSFNPVEINAITIPIISDAFKAEIANTFLEYSYTNQIVTVSSYSIVFNNQNTQKLRSYTYLRYNFELSGNLLSMACSATGRAKTEEGSYQFFNTSFSQFARSDVNITYHQVVDKNNTFAYRFFAGIGYPYGNSKALPFEKRYFSGGANGIRAWQARALGPGSYYKVGETYPNRTADIKLEANVEYRFKLFWQLEGALFFDAGNIWSLPGIEIGEGTVFEFDKFYKQIALGSGLGLRMNLGFFTLRTDFGYKVYDPAINPDIEFRPWVPFQQKFMWSDFNFNFGIGYPF
ncbi:MAG: BamA/TamA family outer membrane protein [Bacteroidales bacterium]|nr:BamA/TamA family outer membrane protein [Bacteroidales bacterium]